jgi:hypothetical protein
VQSTLKLGALLTRPNGKGVWSQVSSPRRRGWTLWTGGATAIVLPTAATALHGALYGRWIVDDAAITFAYARSITEGWGPVAQASGPVAEGWSNPSWLALLIAGRLLGLFDRGAWFGVPDYVAFPKFVAVLCCAAMFAAFFCAARGLSRRPALVATVAGMVVAAVPSFVIWAVSGLENSLLAAAVAWLAALLARAAAACRILTPKVAVLTGFLAALAALTRPDGLIYAGAFPLVALLLIRREQLVSWAGATALSIAAFAMPYTAYVAWRWSTFRELVPNTAIAKSQTLPGLDNLDQPSGLIGYVGIATTLVGLLLIGAALARASAQRAALIGLLVPLGLAVAAFGVLEADWMGEFRFASPVWALGALAGVAAGAIVLPTLAVRGRAAVALAVTAAVGTSGALFVDAAQQFRAAPTVPVCSVAQNMGHTFNGYAVILGMRNGALATPDVGGAALVSRLRIIDIAGLIDPEVAARAGAGDAAGVRDVIFRQRPEFIEIHHGWATGTGLVFDPRLAAGWVKVRDESPTDGIWVRSDLVASPGRLAALQQWDREVAQPAEYRQEVDAPRSSCGPTLTVRVDPLAPVDLHEG